MSEFKDEQTPTGLERSLHIIDTTEESQYFDLPTSPATILTYAVLSSGENIKQLPSRKKAVSHASTMTVQEKDGQTRVELNSGKGKNANTVTIQVDNLNRVGKGNTPAKKLLTLALIEANKQGIINGQNYVSFPLQKLVDLGFYKNLYSARAGFNTGVDILTSLKVKGKDRKHKIDNIVVLFPNAKIKGGQCYIHFNQEGVDWSFILQYFTLLPKYYFSLSNRGSDLLFYIFYLARQNSKAIAERGYFTISFRAIQQQLQLPSEIRNRKPQQQIKKPIEEALEEIEEAQNRGHYQNELFITPKYDERANIKDFLDNGYLKVELTGDLFTRFETISKETEKQIAQAEAKRDKRLEQARAINLAKHLEEEEKVKQTAEE